MLQLRKVLQFTANSLHICMYLIKILDPDIHSISRLLQYQPPLKTKLDLCTSIFGYGTVLKLYTVTPSPFPICSFLPQSMNWERLSIYGTIKTVAPLQEMDVSSAIFYQQRRVIGFFEVESHTSTLPLVFYLSETPQCQCLHQCPQIHQLNPALFH